MGRQPQSHRTREPFVRRPRGDRCGLATHYLHACGISFSQRLFEEGAVIHAHFTGGETKPQSSHTTFPKIRGKTQALHPGPRGAVFCGFAPLRHGRPHLCCHFALPRRGPRIPPGGSPLRSAPLLGPRFRGENEAKRSFHYKCAARPLPVATPVLPRQGLGPEGRDTGDPERKLAQGLAWAPRAGRGLSRGAAGGTITWTAGMRRSGPARGARQLPVRAARTHHATAPERTDRPPGRGRPVCFLLVCSGERGKRCQRRPGEARGFRGSGTKGSPWPGSADVRGAPAPRGARRGLAFVCGTAARSPGEAPAPSGRRGFKSRPAPTHTVASGRSLPYPPSILTGRVAAAKHL